MENRIYETALADFLADLENDRAIFEASALTKLLRQHGSQLAAPHSKSLGGGLFELRGKQIRIFYVFRPGFRILLLDGMLKKRDDIPNRMLRRLRRLQQQIA